MAVRLNLWHSIIVAAIDGFVAGAFGWGISLMVLLPVAGTMNVVSFSPVSELEWT